MDAVGILQKVSVNNGGKSPRSVAIATRVLATAPYTE